MARIEKWDEVHGNQAPDERMMAFLDSATDQYAILQLRRSEDTVYERFSSMRELERMGLEPDIDHYEVVYTAPLLPYKDQNTMLEELYAKFNVSRPDDFTGHSLSVSDIVALRQNGVVSCHYVDSIGFQELPGFLKPENYLKAAEMAMEDDYGMIDGVINNGKKEEPAEKASVLDARFARFRSLGKGYSVEELCEVIAGKAVHKSKFAEKTRTSARSAQVHQKAELSFLIDVRAKMQAGKGAGYARWAKLFNLKQMAKAMMFMEEHGIKSYAELKEQADGISEKCDALLESVKADEARMSEVSVLRKHLINYAKAKDVFAAYKASGYNREFYEAHRDTLALRSAAKKAFDDYKKENGSDKKLPRISELNTEYAMLLERKKSSYAEYRKTKSEMQDWLVAQKIVQEILKEDEQKKEQLHEQEVRQEEENRQSSR